MHSRRRAKRVAPAVATRPAVRRACRPGESFGGTYSVSNDTGFANNGQWSVGAQYEQGGLLVGAALLNADNPDAMSGGAIAGSGFAGADANFASARLICRRPRSS